MPKPIKSVFERAAHALAASRRAPGTRALYEGDLKRWLAHCKEADEDPATPTLELSTTFRDELQETLASLTVRRMLAALSSMYESACAQDPPAASWNPFKARALPRPPATDYAKTEAVSKDDAEKMIAGAEREGTDLGMRDAVVLRLLYETGARISPIATMERANLIWRGTSLVVRVRSKGQKLVEIEVSEKTAEALGHWLTKLPPDSKYIFPSRKKAGSAITSRAFNNRFTQYAKKAGIGHVHPHQFRASYITAALDAGIPLHEVQASVQQADPRTTQRYDRGVRGAGVADAVAKFRAGK